MKTLEERLREIPGERFSHETDPTGSTWIALHDALAIVAEYNSESTEITGTYPELVGGSISSAPGTISFGSENLRYHRDIDAGETRVAGAPRITAAAIRDAGVRCETCKHWVNDGVCDKNSNAFAWPYDFCTERDFFCAHHSLLQDEQNQGE